MAGYHPRVTLGERQWERVVKVLRDRGTKTDAELANRIEGEYLAPRLRKLLLESGDLELADVPRERPTAPNPSRPRKY